MFTRKSKYAIRAVLFLAIRNNISETRISGKEISDSLKMPYAFTVKILQELVQNGIISSTKGPRGGFYLSKSNLDAKLMDLVKVFDDEGYFESCALGLSACSYEHPCPVHHEFKSGKETLRRLFDQKTIGELGKQIEEDKLFLVI
jgi:Rrf2 family protein